MLELSAREYRITMSSTIKTLVQKVENLYQHMENCTGERERNQWKCHITDQSLGQMKNTLDMVINRLLLDGKSLGQ